MNETILESIKTLYLEYKAYSWRTLFHVGLYSFALIMAYNGYKEVIKGYDHVLSHYIGEHIIYAPELPKAVRHSIRETFPWAILIFFLFYSVVSAKYKEGFYLPVRGYITILFCTDFSTNLIFLASNAHAMTVLNLSYPFFFILLFLTQWLDQTTLPVTIYLKLKQRLEEGLAYLEPYTEPLLHLPEKLESNRALVFVTGNSVSVLCTYLCIGVLAYLPTIDHIFRSDHWLFLRLARSPDSTLHEIVSFDMFGHLRLDPLRWLLFYAQNALLGNNMDSYHLLSIAMHAVNGFLIFLIAKIILRANIFPFLVGLLFVVLAGHFDTVVWSLLLDFLTVTFLYLLAVLCLVRYTWQNLSIANVYLAILFSTIPAFMLESFIAGPASIFFCCVLSNYYKKRAYIDKHTLPIACSLLVAYLLFFYLTTSSQVHETTKKMAISDILTWQHVCRGTYAAFATMVDTSFLNNLGIFQPNIEIRNLVNLHALGSWSGGFGILKFLIFAPLVITFFSYCRRNSAWYFTLPILLMSLSSLLTTGIGRIFTGGFNYIVSRSHYGYFPDALFLILLALLTWPPGSERKKLAIYLSLMMLIPLNFKNTRFLNNEVNTAMRGMNTHYQRIKSFTEENPRATLFLDFIPHNPEDRFSMGTDFAFDLLFNDRITKSVRRATHTYDSNSFVENPRYSPETESNTLGDFTVEWLATLVPECLKKEVTVLGPGKTYPKLAVTPAGFIELQVVNPEDGTLYYYGVPYPKWPMFKNDIGQPWVWIIVEKQGKELCFAVNGVLVKKFHLERDYLGWQKDGKELLGSYHRGCGENVQYGRLFVMIDDCKYKCGDLEAGHNFTYDIDTYYQ